MSERVDLLMGAQKANHVGWGLLADLPIPLWVVEGLFAVNVIARIPRHAPVGVNNVIASLAKTSAANGAENYIARAAEAVMRRTL